MSNLHTTKETAISALSSSMASMSGPKIYVGVTNDPERRRSEHGAGHDFTHAQCQTAAIAREVEAYFLAKAVIGGKPIVGGDGGGDHTSVYVYAFSCR